MEILADTTFLIDLQRKNQKALDFLKRNSETSFCISTITIGELMPGFIIKGELSLKKFIYPFPVININEEIAIIYGKIFSQLKKSGTLIGSNDLWIAASGLSIHLSVLTQNKRDFEKVEGLKILTY